MQTVLTLLKEKVFELEFTLAKLYDKNGAYDSGGESCFSSTLTRAILENEEIADLEASLLEYSTTLAVLERLIASGDIKIAEVPVRANVESCSDIFGEYDYLYDVIAVSGEADNEIFEIDAEELEKEVCLIKQKLNDSAILSAAQTAASISNKGGGRFSLRVFIDALEEIVGDLDVSVDAAVDFLNSSAYTCRVSGDIWALRN